MSKEDLKIYLTNEKGFFNQRFYKKDEALEPMTELQAEHGLNCGTIRLEGTPNPNDAATPKPTTTAKPKNRPK